MEESSTARSDPKLCRCIDGWTDHEDHSSEDPRAILPGCMTRQHVSFESPAGCGNPSAKDAPVQCMRHGSSALSRKWTRTFSTACPPTVSMRMYILTKACHVALED